MSATVAEAIASELKSAGIRYVFGHPGGEVTVLIEALRQAGIEFVMTRHEAQAAFIAATLGELTGVPGVCLSTVGPGATNMVSGVAHAWLDRCPLIAITGQTALQARHSTTHQAIDLHQLYGPITKWTAEIGVAAPRHAVRKALATALAERPGPVHLVLANDVSAAEAGKEPFGLPPIAPRPVEAAAWHPAALETAVNLLRTSGPSAILAGHALVRAGAGPALVRLAEALDAPVAVTPKAKGIIPEDHPLFIGVMDMMGDHLLVDHLRRNARALVAAGLDGVEFIRRWPYDVPIIHVDHEPNVDLTYPAMVELAGPPAATLAALCHALKGPAGASKATGGAGSPSQAAAVAEVRGEMLAVLTDQGEAVPDALAAHEVLLALRERLPRNTIATSDVGANKLLSGQLWATYEAGCFLESNGLSSMGYGVPAAAAAKLAHPDRPVVVIVGDGGLGMYLGELETLARLRLPVLICLLDDQSLALIRLTQQRRGFVAQGVDADPIDFTAVARGLGCHAVTAGSPAELPAALDQAMTLLERGDRPVVLHARIDPESYRGKWNTGYGG